MILGGFGALGGLIAGPEKGWAFDNAVEDYAKYVDKPKRRGTPLKDLGVMKRTIEVQSRLYHLAGS